MTNYSRSVLKSNGPHRSKNLPVKFGFSLKSTSTNIVKKLPSQRCPQPFLIPLFNFSHKRLTFAFTPEIEYTLGFDQRIAHSGLHAETGAFPPRPQRGFVPPAKFLLVRHAFIYIHFPVLCDPPLSATALSQTIFHRVFQLLPQTAHVCFHSRKRVHTRLRQQDRTQRHTQRNRGRFGRGRYHYPRHELHIHEHPRAGCQNGKLCRFWVLVGGALEECREPAGQRCAYARRCSEASRPRWAALLCLQLGDVAVLSLCAQYFLSVRGVGGITTLGALCVFSKRWTAACQNDLFAVFLRPLFTFAKDPAG